MKENITAKGVFAILDTPTEIILAKWAIDAFNKTDPDHPVKLLKNHQVGIFPTVGELYYFNIILDSLVNAAAELEIKHEQKVDRHNRHVRKHMGRK